MFNFIVKRFVRFIGAFFIIALAGFWLSSSIPGDPVEQILIKRHGASLTNNLLQSESLKAQLYEDLGLNQPTFYFTINGWHECDTLYKIQNPYLRQTYALLSEQYGCPDQIGSYLHIVDELNINPLKETSDYDEMEALISLHLEANPKEGIQLKTAFEQMIIATSNTNRYLPTINFNGFQNQFHTWFFGGKTERSGLVNGDFGVSVQTGKAISDTIWKKLGYSLEIIFIAICISYLISIPLGFYLNKRPNKIISSTLILLYAIPGFLGGTLLIFFFANKGMLYWFPESGIYPIGYHPNDHGYWANLWQAIPYMVLPTLTLAYSSISFITKLTNNLSEEEIRKDYVRTVRAKGISENGVYSKAILKNIGTPLITLFTQILPAAIGGTLVLEIVFQYPGIGKMTYNAILNNDYPVVIAVFTLTGLLTLTSYFIADLLYLIIDPRIKDKL